MQLLDGVFVVVDEPHETGGSSTTTRTPSRNCVGRRAAAQPLRRLRARASGRRPISRRSAVRCASCGGAPRWPPPRPLSSASSSSSRTTATSSPRPRTPSVSSPPRRPSAAPPATPPPTPGSASPASTPSCRGCSPRASCDRVHRPLRVVIVTLARDLLESQTVYMTPVAISSAPPALRRGVCADGPRATIIRSQMTTYKSQKGISALFASATLGELLYLFMLEPEREYYQRELQQLTGAHLRQVQRDLERLQ